MKAIFQQHKQFLLRDHMEIGFRSWPPMFHHHAELVYVLKGNIKTTVNGENYTVQAGELLVIFPYVVHSYEAVPQADALVLMVAPEAVTFDNTFRTKQPKCPVMDGKPYETMLLRGAELTGKGKIKTAQGYINAVLGEFLEQAELMDADNSARELTVKILDYCNAHCTREITLRQVAQAMYVSQSYISKIFASKFKMSFPRYINQLRVDKAKTLLEEPNMQIQEVMNLCGFQNQSSFNRVFKEVCGQSPRQYRNSLQ